MLTEDFDMALFKKSVNDVRDTIVVYGVQDKFSQVDPIKNVLYEVKKIVQRKHNCCKVLVMINYRHAMETVIKNLDRVRLLVSNDGGFLAETRSIIERIKREDPDFVGPSIVKASTFSSVKEVSQKNYIDSWLS